MTDLGSLIDGALTEKPGKRNRKPSDKLRILGVCLILILAMGFVVGLVYANVQLPGFTSTSTSVAGSATTTALQTAIATQTTTNTVTAQNTTEIQPAVLLFTTTELVTVTTTVGTNTTTYTTGTTITNSTTTTISCPHSPFC